MDRLLIQTYADAEAVSQAAGGRPRPPGHGAGRAYRLALPWDDRPARDDEVGRAQLGREVQDVSADDDPADPQQGPPGTVPGGRQGQDGAADEGLLRSV